MVSVLRHRALALIRRKIVVPLRIRATATVARHEWGRASASDFLKLRERSLAFVEAHRLPRESSGAYAYQSGGPPLLYASCYAALTRHLYVDEEWDKGGLRERWASYIRGFQCEDGLFRDPILAGWEAERMDWWGWRHLTVHAVMALAALGFVAKKRFALLDRFRAPGSLERWLEGRAWLREPANVSNAVHNLGTLMQYARDYHGESDWNAVLARLYDWLDARQDPASGLWGPRARSRHELSQGVQTGYHLWLLYAYDGRPIHHTEAIIASCLDTANKLGGFGPAPNSSACEDLDSIDPLARLRGATPFREEAVGRCLGKALLWVLANANPDGGWVFRRHEGFRYGHDLMSTAPNRGSMFATWFRSLSLACLAQALPGHPLANGRFQFLGAPGYQFWLRPVRRSTVPWTTPAEPAEGTGPARYR